TRFALLISFRMRLYVSSSDFGNSSRGRRKLVGKLCRKTSNWQKTHRNLFEMLDNDMTMRASRRRPHIPSAFSVSLSTTIFFSSPLHFFIFLSVRTTEV